MIRLDFVHFSGLHWHPNQPVRIGTFTLTGMAKFETGRVERVYYFKQVLVHDEADRVTKIKDSMSYFSDVMHYANLGYLLHCGRRKCRKILSVEWVRHEL